MPAHTIERKTQVHCRRPRGFEPHRGLFEIRARWIGARRKRQTICRSNANERRAAHLHGLDCAGGVRYSRKRGNPEFVRQKRLVDDLHALRSRLPPNAPVYFAANPHVTFSLAAAAGSFCDSAAIHTLTKGLLPEQAVLSVKAWTPRRHAEGAPGVRLEG